MDERVKFLPNFDEEASDPMVRMHRQYSTSLLLKMCPICGQPLATEKEEKSMDARAQWVDETLRAKLADEEGLIARGSIDASRLTRYHIWNLCTQGQSRMGFQWYEANAWFEENRPELPEGRY